MIRVRTSSTVQGYHTSATFEAETYEEYEAIILLHNSISKTEGLENFKRSIDSILDNSSERE